MQDNNLIEVSLKLPSNEVNNHYFPPKFNIDHTNTLHFDFQKPISQNEGDLPNLLDLHLNQPNCIHNLQTNPCDIDLQAKNKHGFDRHSCNDSVGRYQEFPPMTSIKKNVSIQNPFYCQSSEDLRSLAQSQSRFSNRRTEATSGKQSIGRESMSSSFFSEGEESNFSRKNSDAQAPHNPSVISTASETVGQKNQIKLGVASNNQVFNRSQNQIKKQKNSLVCIEDLIFQQSLSQEEQQFEGKTKRMTIPTTNNNFQDEVNDNQILRAISQQQQQQATALKSPLNQQIFQQQQSQQAEIKTNTNNNNNQQKIPTQTALQNQNLPDLLDECSFINITIKNTEQKNQVVSSPQGESGGISDKDSPDKRVECETQYKPQIKVFNHQNEDETSSDDPEMIKPVGFTIHIDHEDPDNQNEGNTSVSSKKKRKKNIISHKDLKYKQITYIEAWSRIKTMDLSKEKKFMMVIRDRMYQNGGMFSRFFQLCSINSSRNLQSAGQVQERDQVLAFSKVAFDTSDSLHVNMNYTIYCGLRNTQYCPLYGTHWLTIGFRHVNPKQNYEVAGVFGCLQILAFIFCYREYLQDVIAEIDTMQKQNEDIKIQIQNHTHQHQQAHNNSQNSSSSSSSAANAVNCNNCLNPERLRFKEINLCVILQEVSKHVLIWLEKGLLNSLINIEKSVISAVNKIYFATFYIFYERFKREKSGFLSISIAFKTTIEFVEADPSHALDLFKKKICLYYKLRE